MCFTVFVETRYSNELATTATGVKKTELTDMVEDLMAQKLKVELKPDDVKNIFGSSITKQGSIEISGIGFKRGDNDGFMDVIVHSDANNKYKIYLDGEIGLINETQLAWIIAKHTQEQTHPFAFL